MIKCHYKRVKSFCRHCRWWYLYEGALARGIHTRLLVISTVCIRILEEKRKGSDKFLSVLMLLPVPCNTKRVGTKVPMLFQNALYKMQELHSIELSQFPCTRSCYASLAGSMKEQFKPLQLCHFPSLSSAVWIFRWGKRQQTEQICL